jgi:uncharacterized membrane protein YgaE (UPF0421/DUF939 family)
MIPIRIVRSRAAFMRGLQLSLRASVAAALAYVVAQFLKLEYPIYALIAAVIVSDLSPARTTRLGVQRLIATIIGTACGIAASNLLPGGIVSIAVSIMVAMLICHVLHAPDSAKVAGYVCGIIVIAYAADPWSYALYRFIETCIGMAIAWLISLIPKLFVADNDDPAKPG